MGFYGAETDQLRGWGDLVDRGIRALEQERDLLDRSVSVLAWVGEDAESFRSRWHGRRSELESLIHRLQGRAEEAGRHAEEQDAASSVGGGSSDLGPGGGRDQGGDHSPRDQPGNPKSGDLGDYQEFEGQIDLSDEALDSSRIDQGSLGDCWFLAGAGAVADHDPDFIREHMQENDDGSWTVTLYHDGEPVEITVEPSFPEDGAGGPDGVNWISIYEKAAAEYYGGDYSALEGGYSSEAFEMVTGQEAQRSGEGDFDSLQDRLGEGPVAVGTQNNDVGDRGWRFWESELDDDTIVPNHAYIVEEIVPADDPRNHHDEPAVILTNPWGPDGGSLNGHDRDGTLVLTEQEYQDNFDSTYSVALED